MNPLPLRRLFVDRSEPRPTYGGMAGELHKQREA
jgi:hypothetical protein